MTAKDPSVRRGVQASSLTLSLLLALGAVPAADFLDVEQVEVLRGPQGTLYGKNTTAGAINITTNQPTFDFEGRAEVSVGNLNYRQAKAAVSGPLSDTIAARLAIAATSRRGTIFNVTRDRWINEQDNLGLRGQLLFKPGEISASRCRATIASRIPKAMAPRSSASAGRSAHSRANMMGWSRPIMPPIRPGPMRFPAAMFSTV